ncbi:hypothetical protein [Pantanalinema sp. GBBB05]|uniref:hypothetical protein n=1 Tax=Pantanalinema sp. GBBB05 TaxID=2604139 RepID=UPI001DB5AB70|nr:hypothetical protein [Pantanalinema sp. GBBB05]
MTIPPLKFSCYQSCILLASGVPFLSCLVTSPSALSAHLPILPAAPSVLSRSRPVPPPKRYTCPITLEPLATTMLRDLPSYMNRLQRRLPRRKQQPDENLYTIAASLPEFEELPIGSSEYASPKDTNLRQIFFTTLERQYTEQGTRQWQSFHWLFLSPDETGWQLALLFSRQGDYPRNEQPLTPPRDASQSITALAIRAWLRDCQAGAIRPF